MLWSMCEQPGTKLHQRELVKTVFTELGWDDDTKWSQAILKAPRTLLRMCMGRAKSKRGVELVSNPNYVLTASTYLLI